MEITYCSLEFAHIPGALLSITLNAIPPSTINSYDPINGIMDQLFSSSIYDFMFRVLLLRPF